MGCKSTSLLTVVFGFDLTFLPQLPFKFKFQFLPSNTFRECTIFAKNIQYHGSNIYTVSIDSLLSTYVQILLLWTMRLIKKLYSYCMRVIFLMKYQQNSKWRMKCCQWIANGYPFDIIRKAVIIQEMILELFINGMGNMSVINNIRLIMVIFFCMVISHLLQ